MIKATSSIVLYNTNVSDLKKVLDCLIKEESISIIYLIDNSPEINTFNFKSYKKVVYFHNKRNIGFGAAHNFAIKLATENNSKYHFIINPDVYFKEGVIIKMLDYITNNPSVGMMMPKILNIDGSEQNLPKLFPDFIKVLVRVFKLSDKSNEKFELRAVKNNVNVPTLSGCFNLLNINLINRVRGYDERYFLYFEDWDLSRRVNQKYKTIFYPKVSVYHKHNTKSNKKFKLTFHYVKSMIRYFNKWGWFLTKDLKEENNKILSSL